MKIDLTPFENALVTLKEVLVIYQQDHTDAIVRDSCIQRFEYCYGLATKMLRRYLEIIADEKEVIDTTPFPDLIRMAAEKGILRRSWDVWEKFRKARNQTSHTYDEKIAAEVMLAIPLFYEEAIDLLRALQKGNT